MNSTINALVLKAKPFGDNDLILTLLSKESGKIDAIAKGAKRSKKSPLYTQPFAYSEFSVFKGKNLYTINSAELRESFYDLRSDIASLCLGQYFLEAASAIPKATVTGEECLLLKLILNSLFLLCKNKNIDMLTVKIIFELKYAAYSGFAPNFEECTDCGDKNAHLWVFNEGVKCEKCAEGKRGVRINSAIQKIVCHILKNDGISAYSFQTDNEILKYLSDITENYLSYVLETEFKTLQYYKDLGM